MSARESIVKRFFFSIIVLAFCASALGQAPDFIDHSVDAGLLGNYLNHTAAVADYDLDGDLDVYVGSRLAANTLYRNEGGAEFVPVELGVEDEGFTMASLFFDFDNDGDPDLFSCNSGESNRFWRNDGGAFTEISDALWANTDDQCRGAHAADVNQDGWLDLYVVNMSAGNELWLGDGNGGFTDGYLSSGASDDLIGMGAIFFDIENDGDLDLYLTHDANQANKLYINDGTGAFDEQAEEWGLDLEAQGMGVDIADLNHDGFMDLYISNNLPNDLFMNPGPPSISGMVAPFTNITESAGVGDAGMGWGTVFIDYDHDGERDLYVANEFLFSPFLNLLYHNQGDLTFTDVAEGTPLESPFSGYASVAADFDFNGTEDLLVVNTLSGSNPGCQLFLNADTTHHWIGFELEGVVSPRDAAGARVVVHAGADFVRTDQSALGNSYSSCGPLTFNFGLADQAAVDSVEFFWPSGLRTVLESPDVDQYHTVLETSCSASDLELDWPSAVELCPGETVLFEVPQGWTASSWTGGEAGPNGQSFGESGMVQALLTSSDGCAVLSPLVPLSLVQAAPPVVVLDGPSTFCSGGVRGLWVQDASLSIQWSNGGQGDTLWVSESSTITVTTTNACGYLDTSDPIDLEVLDSPANPIVTPVVLPLGQAHTFEPVVLDDGQLHWFDPLVPFVGEDILAGTTPELGPFLSSSATFSTGPLAASQGWLVQSKAQRNVETVQGGKEDISSGGFINSDSYGLSFDVHEPLILNEVRMRASSDGPRVVQVLVPQLGVVASLEVELESGWNDVPLGFELDPGQGYRLMVSGDDIELWRDNVSSEMDYPYAIGELATITGSTIPNNAGLGYYYFFYDWSVTSQGLGCASDPVPAWVEVVNGLSGCTYSFAINYNPAATFDDGSCVLGGCLNPEAVNFSPIATIDDGSCSILCESDINGDGVVGLADLLSLLSNWGTACD